MTDERTGDSTAERYRTVARMLHDVVKPMRVLAALAWPGEIRRNAMFTTKDTAQLLNHEAFSTSRPA